MAYSRDELSKMIQTFTNGLYTSTSDLLLLSVYYNFTFQYDGGVNGHERDAFNALGQIQPSTLKRAFVHLKQKGMVTANPNSASGYDLTDEGRNYIYSIVPRYNEDRSWEGRVHVITYDLPVEKNSERNAFRSYLKEIGCGMLQQSVWISVYNPTDQVRGYIDEKGLNNELIIVSSVGNDGYIGNMSFNEVVEKVYSLSKINQSYKNFLHMVSEGVTREWTIFVYLKILASDPQLPFNLQPQDWAGYEAFVKYKEARGF